MLGSRDGAGLYGGECPAGECPGSRLQSDSGSTTDHRRSQGVISERFKAADANHDGKLSRDEAKAGMPQVYKNFSKIDSLKRGYVTERQIGAYWEAKTKEQMQKENPIWN